MSNDFSRILKIINEVEKNHSYFDEEQLREFYEVFGDNINVVVKFGNGHRNVLTITEFYNLDVDYLKMNMNIREVFLCSEDYRNLLEMRKVMMEF